MSAARSTPVNLGTTLPAVAATVQPTIAPTLQPSTTPEPTVAVNDWVVACDRVSRDDCRRIAGVFVYNLARSQQRVHDESGGRLTVAPQSGRPFLWQASAATSSGTICMVIAHMGSTVNGAFGFGQVGGDDMSGRAGPPPTGWAGCI
jgi:hypothetical protein